MGLGHGQVNDNIRIHYALYYFDVAKNPALRYWNLFEKFFFCNSQNKDIVEVFAGFLDAASFKTITEYIDFAKSSPDMEIIAGGGYDDSKGYFIEPTVVLSKDADPMFVAP